MKAVILLLVLLSLVSSGQGDDVCEIRFSDQFGDIIRDFIAVANDTYFGKSLVRFFLLFFFAFLSNKESNFLGSTLFGKFLA